MIAQSVGTPGDGRLISIEGIDACGKSSVARELCVRLADAGRPVYLLDRHQATAGLDGYPAAHLAALRALIWDYPQTTATSQLGFDHWAHLIGAWFHAVDHLVVRPLLERGTWVVADSTYHKFAARFCLSVGPAAGEAPFAGVRRPDLTVWLDTPPEVCVTRRAEHRATERGEWAGLDGGAQAFVLYQGRVRAVYAEFAKAHRWHRFADAAGLDEVVDRAFRLIAGPMAVPVLNTGADS